MDEKPETTPPAYSQDIVTHSPTRWRGNMPCVCNPTGGCSRHNPTTAPIFYNPVLPADNQRPKTKEFFVRQPPKPAPQDPVQPGEPVSVSLPLDASTVDPLTPILPSIPYALAWYHVHWARAAAAAAEQRDVRTAAALDCAGVCRIGPDDGPGPVLRWTAKPRWIGASLFLQQTASFGIAPTKRHPLYRKSTVRPKYQLTACPHLSHRIVKVVFEERRGIFSAEVKQRVRTKSLPRPPPKSQQPEIWKSMYSTQIQTLTSCPRCCTDMEVVVEMGDQRVDVYVATFRDLGKGADRTDEKWIAALRGKSTMARDASLVVRNAMLGNESGARGNRR
ncbi:Uu.00g039420.m01.CDS01 [Anthostomella pinea]|uniref:Uu.00g039420.m01.CDS01 n=1 Tax=Anthostomella pinea TaxID=933095 RepID=A0AAI8YBF2_9PEZI|nr:Uu.00g039420.m01.CDS01 [Anthostomella pinea]